MHRSLSLTLLVALLGLGCGSTSSSKPANEAPSASSASAAGQRSDIDVNALQAALDSGSVRKLVDVRTPGEFAEGHVPGAVNIPLDTLGGRVSELGDGPVHVICRSGSRSSRATDLLVGEGVDATNVKGGTLAWIAAGYPTE